ncbi:hypothetical protein K7X08_006112 [Anisodus acutangulus]|uniref:Glutaredoxin domain-containing protein n=1 Tax=Anisodus acutangulus TaxID=402998 RepID=A0A9Q1R7I5_9SOLA|nr:hypothetical protein K7X08_006112 [Anisodus acutangulus]
MLVTRTKSKIWVRNNNSPNFSCPSFKDIQTLFSDDSNSTYSPIPTKKPNIFHRVRRVNAILRALTNRPGPDFQSKPESTRKSDPLIQIPGAEKKIVIYFTSLRVIRSTFDDCKTVRSILRSFRVSIDERDVSMDAGFMEELKTILGKKTKLSLPRVFIGGRYIGGAEEIRQLHEAGELKKYVEGLIPADFSTCEVCGGHRFVLCDECSGSHKCYSEKGGFRTCTGCNENGLIRCPSCYYAPITLL